MATTGNDKLVGGSGDDILYGDAGDDGIVGGAGNDILRGGTGNDVMIGGAGDDKFTWLFKDFTAGGVDTIYDFHGAGDGRVVSGGGEQDYLIFSGLGAGSSLTFIEESTTFSPSPSNPTGRLYYYDLYSSTSGLHQTIAVVSINGQQLVAGDFLFVA